MEPGNTSKVLDTRALTAVSSSDNDCSKERQFLQGISGFVEGDDSKLIDLVVSPKLNGMPHLENEFSEPKVEVRVDLGRVEGEEKPDETTRETASVNCPNELITLEISTSKTLASQGKSNDEEDTLACSTQSAFAFTIDFGDTKTDHAKYQNLLKKYNARCRRNFSTPKVTSEKKVDINTSKLTTFLKSARKQKAPSIHSEGYFSSDQEDDSKRKLDQPSRKGKQLPAGQKSDSRDDSISKKADSTSKYIDQPDRHETSDLRNEQMNDAQSLLEETKKGTNSVIPLALHLSQASPTSKIMNNSRQTLSDDTDEEERIWTRCSLEIQQSSNTECIQTTYGLEDNCIARLIIDDRTENESKVNCFESVIDIDPNIQITNDTNLISLMDSKIESLVDINLDLLNVTNFDTGSEEAPSETGTYTIHKDYTDEEKARMDIDKVFSVGVLTEEESKEAYVHSFKTSISRDSSTWISEWASQVAEHNSLPPLVGDCTGRTSPLSPTKIPSPIHSIHSRSQRGTRNRQEQSDSSLDTESYLLMKDGIGSSITCQTLIDSGGESDEDTSNSYNTPPHSSQRTPIHNSIVRRGSLTEALFKSVNTTESRRSIRNCSNADTKLKTEEIVPEILKSPSNVLAGYKLGRRNSSLDRREFTFDSIKSTAPTKNNLKICTEVTPKYANIPTLNDKPSTPKLPNSPMIIRNEFPTKMNKTSIFDRTKGMAISSTEASNIGYFTCTENSPYMLRKSSSTSNNHKDILFHGARGLSTTTINLHQNSPVSQRKVNIQRSSSNASIKNPTLTGLLARRSSFNNSDNDKSPLRGRTIIPSDSSSETGEVPSKSTATAPAISAGIKLNRAFSIRRARLNCDSDTTPSTTPEERRRGSKVEVRSASTSLGQQNHRGRIAGTGTGPKESYKKPELPRPRAPSMTRTDSGRISMRIPKTGTHYSPSQRSTHKLSKDNMKPGRSNSTLTSKEVEFQNWKRRKSYDPMKAAAEGKKKLESSKKYLSTEDGSTT